MQYKIEWIEAPWLLRLKWWGVASLPDYRAMVNHEMRYMDSANGRLYWITDLRESGSSSAGQFDPQIMK
jgi:hypothetical protein